MSHGGVREWTNGNLHAFVEPTATGHRLRLRTHQGNAKALMVAGTMGLILGVLLTAFFFLEQLGRASLVLPVLMAVLGSGVLASSALRLPRWAREREGQMEYIAGRVGALLDETPP